MFVFCFNQLQRNSMSNQLGTETPIQKGSNATTSEHRDLHRLRTRLQEAPFGLITFAPRGEILSANEKAETLLKGTGTGDDLIGELFRDRLQATSFRDFEHLLHHGFSEGLRRTCTVELRRTDGGARFLEITVWEITEENSRLTAVVRDITQRVLAHQERQELKEKLHHSQRMEALGRLTSGIAHDFNNLLTLILGYSRLAIKELPEDHPFAFHANQIQRAGQQASQLIDQLLVFGDSGPAREPPLDVNNLLIDMRPLMERVVGGDAVLRLRLKPSVLRTSIDAATLQQVLINLLITARDSINVHEEVILVTTHDEFDAAKAADLGLTPGLYVILNIATDADGRDRQEPFGFPTTRALLHERGGAIEFDVASGQTRVFLPVADGESPQDEPVRRTILVVDDQPELRRFASMVLEGLDAEILSASTSVDALEKARTLDSLALLVADVVMPELTGPELFQKLREWHPTARAIFISGHDRQRLYNERGIDRDIPIVEKPFCPDTLRTTVESLLSEES